MSNTRTGLVDNLLWGDMRTARFAVFDSRASDACGASRAGVPSNPAARGI